MDVTAIFYWPNISNSCDVYWPNISDIHKSKLLLTALGQTTPSKTDLGERGSTSVRLATAIQPGRGPNCDCTRWEDDVTGNLPRNLTLNLKVPLLGKGNTSTSNQFWGSMSIFRAANIKIIQIEVMSCWKENHPKRDHIIILNLSFWFVSNTSKQKEMRPFNQNKFNHGMLTYPVPLLVPLVISR